MSTKIFGAYECEFDSIEAMHDQMQELRTVVHPFLVEKLKRRVAADWAIYIDDCTMENKTIKKLFYEVSMEVTDKHNEIKKTGNRNIDYDFYFELVVIPHNHKTYVKIFAEHVPKKATELLEMMGKEFHYQNSTDRPESISEEEWKRREKIWDEITEKGRCFREWGFIYDFSIHDIYDAPFNPEEVEEFIPTKEARARRIAREQIVTEQFGHKKNISYSIVRDIHHYLETDEAKKKVNKRIKTIMPTLIDTICETDLKGKIQTQP